MVPIYRIEYEVPVGVVVQDVQVLQRDGLQSDIGLNLPLAVALTDATAGPNGILIEAEPGWYPDRQIDWQVVPDADRTSTLVVTLYPFEYNAQTTESRFYNQYTLDIEAITSEVCIESLLTDSQSYTVGDVVSVNLNLTAEWVAQDAYVDTVVRQYGSDELVAGLLLESLSDLTGTASYAAAWDSTDMDSGYYYVETKVVDTASQVLAHQSAMFKLIQ